MKAMYLPGIQAFSGVGKGARKAADRAIRQQLMGSERLFAQTGQHKRNTRRVCNNPGRRVTWGPCAWVRRA